MVDITIRTIKEQDFPRLAEFLIKGFPTTSLETWKLRFEMWWLRNPVRDPSIPYGWVLEKDTAIIGFIGNIPVKFQIAGKEGRAVAASSWCVDPPYRGIQSMRLLAAFNAQPSVDLFLHTTPTPDVQRMLPRYQYVHHAFPFNKTEYIRIVDYRKSFRFLTKYLATSQSFLSFPIGSTSKGILASFLRSFTGTPEELNHDHLTCAQCTSCDAAFDTLWEQWKTKCETTLSRDTTTLNWLFFSQAIAEKRIVIQCTNSTDGTLLGYMAFDIENPPHIDVKVMQLKDVCILKDTHRVLHALLSFATNVAKAEGTAFISLWSNSEEMDLFFKKTVKITRTVQYGYFYKPNLAKEAHGAKLRDSAYCPSVIDPDQGCI